MDHPRRRSRRLTSWTALAALALLYGCAGDGRPLTGGGQFDEIQQNIFDQHCLSAGCHNSQSLAGDLNLSSGASYDQLVNVIPQNPVARADGLLRVQPFNPGNSFLLIKLTGPGEGEGTRMPQGMNPLPQSDIDMIQAWIVAGAPRGDSTPGTPTTTPGESPTPTPLATATVTDTPTAVATNTPASTPTTTGTPPTATATSTGPVAPTATATPSASASPSPSPTPTQDLFREIQSTIFNVSCTGAFCHDLQGMSGDLVLIEGLSYDNLVGVEPMNLSAQRQGLLRVDPGDPENSFLLIKVTDPPPIQGSRMPLNEPALTPEQIQLIRDWIAAGAAR